ncbi:putative membrane protein [Arthrobacter sp. OAP107]
MVPEVNSASTHARESVVAARQVTPQDAWVLAPLIAGENSYRVGRWIGTRFQYPRPATPHAITTSLPDRPAAVMIHGADGSVATLCIDLDTSKALKSVVDSDAARLRKLLDEANVGFVEDFSPSGGRHIYIPLQQRLTAAKARELVEALGLLAASLDPSPHQNITDGCIRVPGSRHKAGGYQTLITPLANAYATLRVRNSPHAVAALGAALAPELARNKAIQERQAKAATAARTTAAQLPLVGRSESPLRRIARTGLYDTAKYASPSEARMGVLDHFAGCGWSLQDVENELNGQFPGLAALYGTQANQARLLPTEWAKAQAYTNAGSTQKRRSRETGKDNALINNTSPTKLTGGATDRSATAIHQLVNDLENVLYAVLDHRLAARGREGVGLRLLMRGLLGYMRAKETDLLDVGCRTLAVALGKHHVTIARLLPVLAQASDGILTKVADARHKTADVYLIQLPEHYQKLAREVTWRKGRIHAVRPVFRHLGDVAALVYEAIERARHSPTTAEIVRATSISRNAVSTALADMEALGMIRRDHGQWKCAAANLTDLAARLGVLEDYQSQISRYRFERAAWHAYLDRFLTNRIEEHDLYDPERDEYWLPPGESHIWFAA